MHRSRWTAKKGKETKPFFHTIEKINQHSLWGRGALLGMSMQAANHKKIELVINVLPFTKSKIYKNIRLSRAWGLTPLLKHKATSSIATSAKWDASPLQCYPGHLLGFHNESPVLFFTPKLTGLRQDHLPSIKTIYKMKSQKLCNRTGGA